MKYYPTAIPYGIYSSELQTREEHGGSVVEFLTGDRWVDWVQTSLEELCCVLEQETLSSA